VAIEGNPKMLVRDIAEGYSCFTASSLRRFLPQDLKILNPEFAVAIYCGLQTLAATLVVCFETPVFLTRSQR
jgi:hypothetical protein